MKAQIAESSQVPPASVIRLIHRRDDAFCGLYEVTKGAESNRRVIAGIRARSLSEEFPNIESNLVGRPDRYMTVNGFWLGRKFETVEVTNWISNKKQFLRSINAVHVDIDCYNAGVTWRQVIAQIGDLADVGEIPQPSIFAKSGRGCYVLWLIRDEADELPPFAWDRNVCLTERLNREIVSCFDHFGADPRATDASRILRVPGSIHSGTNETVTYMVQLTESGSVPTYTLADLARWFDLPVRIESRRKAFDPTREKGSRAGYEAVARKRANDLEFLFERRLIQQGSRRYALRLFALSLRTMGVDRETATRELLRAAHRCVPAYPTTGKDQPPREIAQEIYRLTAAECFEFSRMKHDNVVRRLKIPTALLADLETLITDEERTRRASLPSPSQVRKEDRLKCFARLLAANPDLSTRKAAVLAAKSGHSCSHRTAARILSQMKKASLKGTLLSEAKWHTQSGP